MRSSSEPTKTASEWGYIDVVGEADRNFGFIKISFHLDADNPSDCPEWESGEFDGLEALTHRSISLGDIHWNAWLIFRHLRPYHVAGDWFDVRHLVEGADWDGFLTGAIEGTLTDCRPVIHAKIPLDDTRG